MSMSVQDTGLTRAERLRQLRAAGLSRRAALRLLAGMGAAAAVGRGSAQAAPPAAAGSPAATPALGLQPDGSRVWRVPGGAMEEAAGGQMVEAVAFAPQELTINAGDRVFFDFGSPAPRLHTVTFLGGQQLPSFIVPDQSAATPGASPAAGPPRLMLNPMAAFPVGSAYANSGIPAARPPEPFLLSFPKEGSYEYLCLVHPETMKGKVTVQAKGAALPHEPAEIDAAAADHLAKLIVQAKALLAQHAAAGTPTADGAWELTAGAAVDQLEAHAFLPQTLTIKVGDRVRWVNRTPHVPHTVTFVSGAEPPDFIVPEPQAGGPPKLTLNPAVVAPAGGAAYHGAGYVNSGFLGKEFGGPQSYELTFDTPGAYPYFCAIHGSPTGGMHGTITVA